MSANRDLCDYCSERPVDPHSEYGACAECTEGHREMERYDGPTVRIQRTDGSWVELERGTAVYQWALREAARSGS